MCLFFEKDSDIYIYKTIHKSTKKGKITFTLSHSEITAIDTLLNMQYLSLYI